MARLDNRIMVVFIITLFIAIMLLGYSRESSSQNTFNIGQFENVMKGVKLKLKEINSSPLNSNGEKPCKFTFEVLD